MEIHLLLKVDYERHRVHSLTGRITSVSMQKHSRLLNVIAERRVSTNSLSVMFQSKLEENLARLMRELKEGTYQPLPLRRA
uniref:Uncharacterized protein n=1 Tax=Candidatus Kentrum sp. TC TaxID=2126339 RepID=A0A450Z0X3_9GAMM|nr:MAG: hypothetical protein BECKTC1821D_GA0114238_10462 [Candidatus Kentron sp. TC]